MKSITFKQALLIAIGSSIGGGIYFKSDDVIRASQGNVVAATLGWVILGLSFVFAGLAISVLANKTTRAGGIIAYVEDTFGEKAGFATGWFFAVFYSPTQVGILVWIVVTYGLEIFDLNSEILGVHNFYLLIVVVMIIMFGWNILSTKFAAFVSAFSTSVKLIPLLVIPILAFTGFEPSNWNHTVLGMDYVAQNQEAVAKFAEAGLTYDPNASFLKLFMAPLLAMAFTFDGWHTVGSLSVDMENPQRDLSKVFSVSLIVVTAVYAIYFLGMNLLIPADQLIIQGDAHVDTAVQALFKGIGGETLGFFIGKSIMVFVTISVIGSTNSFMMGSARYIHALAEEGNFFAPRQFRQFSPKFGTPAKAAFFQLCLTLVFLISYYTQEAFGWFDGIVIDELPVAFEAVFFIPIMLAAFLAWKKDKAVGPLKGVIAPILGALGQVFILVAFFTNNSNALLYFGVCIGAIIIGLICKVIWFDPYRKTDEFLNREKQEITGF